MADHTPTPVFRWRSPWTEEPGGLQSKELDMTETKLAPKIMYVCVYIYIYIYIYIPT